MTRRPRRQFAALPLDSAGVMWTAAIVLMGLAAVTFVQSAAALAELAVWLPTLMRWSVPVSVDAAIVIFTVVALIQRGRGRSTFYPWAMVGLFTAISIYANISHAIDTVGTSGMDLRQIFTSALLGGLAPFLVFSASHALSLIAVERPEDEAEREAAMARQVRTAPARTAAAKAPARAADKPARASVPAAAVASEAEVAEWIATTIQQQGSPPTAQAIGERLGMSRKTGERFRERVLDELALAGPSQRRALEAVS